MSQQPMTDESPNHAQQQGFAPAVGRALDLWNTSLGREFGPLSRRQRRALLTLHDLSVARPTVRVSDLAERLGVTTAGATRMLSKLEEFGFISRFREPEGDQREVFVGLTDAGNHALRQANEVYFARVERALNGLDPEEKAVLARLLAKLTNDIDR